MKDNYLVVFLRIIFPFYVYEYFTCVYVCIPCAFLGLVETITVCHILELTLQVTSGHQVDAKNLT